LIAWQDRNNRGRHLSKQARAQIEARDLELINKAADGLNEEAEASSAISRHRRNLAGNRMKRGEIYRVHHPRGDPKLYRCFVVVSRHTLIDSRFAPVVCAPILTRGHGFSTQVSVGIDEGWKHESWILCDHLLSPRKVQMTRFAGTLGRSKGEELDRALKMSLAFEWVVQTGDRVPSLPRFTPPNLIRSG
jgi:mRNA interferase MazF